MTEALDTKTSDAQGHNRWQARTFWSVLLRLLVMLVPVAAGVGAAIFLSHALPRPQGLLGSALWWLILFVASATVASMVDRVARRMLPLAVLLGLTMIFPDRAPSRFAMARQVGSIRNLEERLRHAREHGVEDDPAKAAETILTLVAALSLHDRRTRGHSERVRALTDMLADELRLDRDARDKLRWAALLHDIGKLEVEARVLNKPGKPTAYEWESLKRHPEEGARLAAPLLPWLGQWAPAIEQHHERFDGGGYPRGLAGEEISPAGRILTITDSFETMTAARSYKKPMSVVTARRELAKCAGAQFDPVIVRRFLNISIGRMMWQVGPASWLAQLPFVGVRDLTGPLAAGTRIAVGALARAVLGIAALGTTGLVNLPAPVERPAVTREVSATSLSAERPAPEDRASRPTPRPGPGSETDDGKGDDGGSGPGRGGDDDGLVDDVKDVVEDPVGSVKDVVEDPVGSVKDVVDDATDAVEDTTDAVTDAVEDTTDAVKDSTDAVQDAVDDLTGGL